jgi:hypothetical protein
MLLAMALAKVPVPPFPAPPPPPLPQDGVVAIFSSRAMTIATDPIAQWKGDLQFYSDQTVNQKSTLARDLGLNDIRIKP